MSNNQTSLIIGVFGDGGVGKSACAIQFVHNDFIEEYDPTIDDSYRKEIKLDNGATVLLDILDSAGSDVFPIMRQQWMESSRCGIFMYSITSRSSFEELPNFLKIWETAHQDIPDLNKPLMIVGNKIDLEDQREVSTEEGKKYADSIGANFLETSAKTPLNIDKMFQQSAELAFSYNKQKQDAKNNETEKCEIQ